jgi:hypothetical protein
LVGQSRTWGMLDGRGSRSLAATATLLRGHKRRGPRQKSQRDRETCKQADLPDNPRLGHKTPIFPQWDLGSQTVRESWARSAGKSR